MGKNGEITQYTGNYSDYLRKRPTQEPIKQTTAPKPAKPKAPAKPAKLRFSFKEQREFETIDDDIAALQAQLDACQQEIDANASDYLRLQALMQQHELLSAQLEEKTERWVYLNDLAEQIARQS